MGLAGHGLEDEEEGRDCVQGPVHLGHYGADVAFADISDKSLEAGIDEENSEKDPGCDVITTNNTGECLEKFLDEEGSSKKETEWGVSTTNNIDKLLKEGIDKRKVVEDCDTTNNNVGKRSGHSEDEKASEDEAFPSRLEETTDEERRYEDTEKRLEDSKDDAEDVYGADVKSGRDETDEEEESVDEEESFEESSGDCDTASSLEEEDDRMEIMDDLSMMDGKMT